MKTKITKLLLLFTIFTTTLVAGGLHENTGFENPITDGTEIELVRPEVLINRLLPATPKVADFNSEFESAYITNEFIAPATPKETDFEEVPATPPVQAGLIAPYTPAEADFFD